jgi:uncharacterized membrane protein
MLGNFISPNWHVALIHYPIALLSLGLLIELLSFWQRVAGLRSTGRWMILFGALSGLPVLTAGIYAFRDVVTPGPISLHSEWHQVVQRSEWISLHGGARRVRSFATSESQCLAPEYRVIRRGS